MGLAKGPTHANNKSYREIRVSRFSNKSVDWAKSSPLGSLSHGMGSLEIQFDHDAHRGLMEASMGFPDMPMGSVLSWIREGLHLLLHDPLLTSLSSFKARAIHFPILSEVFLKFFSFLSQHFFLSLEFLHMVFVFPAKELVSMFTNIYLAVSGLT